MSNQESETVLSKLANDTWSTPDQTRIETFLAAAALRLDGELYEVDL